MTTFRFTKKSILICIILLFHYAAGNAHAWTVNGWDEPDPESFTPKNTKPFKFPDFHNASLNTWLCSTYSGTGQIALVENSSESYILMDDTKIDANSYLDGLDRRWDWNKGQNSVILGPSGSAGYYEFKNKKETSPSSLFKCRKYNVDEKIQQVEKHKILENWRKLDKGMTKKQVRGLLGEPYKVETGSISQTWNYGKSRYSDGNVEFRK